MRHEDVIERLPELVLGQLPSGEGVLVDDHLRTCEDCSAELSRLTEIHRIAALDPPPPPPALGRQILDAAFARREPSNTRSSWPALSAWENQIIRFRELLADLAAGPGAEWETPCIEQYELSIRDVACHLIAIESEWGSRIGALTIVPETEPAHATRTRLVADRHRSTPPSELLLEFDLVVDATRNALRSLSEADLAGDSGELPGMSVEAYVAFRAFETWIHADDIRTAVGHREVTPAGRDLAAMGPLLPPWVALAFRLHAPELEDHRIRFELTGSGGSSFDVGREPFAALSDDAAPDLVITADIVDFCKLAGARKEAGDLRYQVVGDRELADRAVAAIPELAGM